MRVDTCSELSKMHVQRLFAFYAKTRKIKVVQQVLVRAFLFYKSAIREPLGPSHGLSSSTNSLDIIASSQFYFAGSTFGGFTDGL